MNKYQKALGVIEKVLIQQCPSDGLLMERTELEALKELVDRATPKKVTVVHSNRFYFDGLCPNCNRPLFDGSDMFFKEKHYQFCAYCGQALEETEDGKE